MTLSISQGEKTGFCAETKQDRAKNFSLGQSERSEVLLHKYRARLLKLCVCVGVFQVYLYLEGRETLN